MNRKHKSLLSAMAFVVLSALQVGTSIAFGQPPGQGQRASLPPIPIKGDTTHTLSRYFTPASSAKKAPDAKGFIQRWLVLEPVKKDIARNSIFTDSYLRTTFSTDNFSSDYTTVPKNGESVKVGNQELKWYALDSKTFNFNLYHFTYAINKPVYGILVWLVTVIDCPEEMKNVRMTAGCNSASMWWLNGQEALMLSGDRDMIADNVTSQRLTLKKGKNIIRGAVINGPGMANFCVRFLDEKGVPIKNISISYQ
ncbi:MAG: acetylxylan esterase [Bacteroidetes bacterium]|nr:MAG: acetylxylan esterase [Bacteroidota bacterium]